MRQEIKSIWPDELRQYFQEHNEQDYILVDVRQPKEYTRGHIPGAELLPLKTLTNSEPELPKDKDLIFYCARGVRSRVAADFTADSAYDPQKIFSLMGGISSWEGAVLPDFPKVKYFEDLPELADLIPMAMNLEKGAFLFYTEMRRKFTAGPMAAELEKIAAMEMAHARLLYDFLNRPAGFTDYFDALGGDIIEGGMPLRDALQKLDDLPGDGMVNALEMALEIEHSAYDLYRSLANSYSGEKSASFLRLSQAEKEHIRLVAQLFAAGQDE
jgi:rhodanese-related sulfurtransferase/rubrerythrin